MSKKIRITYRQHPSVTPEEEREVRARAWQFIFDCYEKRRATEMDNEQG